MISIIIPIFNAEQWLTECLESIVHQSYIDFEVLMVDDGSRDTSAAICKGYEERDERFHYFHQGNAGVSVARNTGLQYAKGEWISFVDSDDTIDKDFLKEMFNHIDDSDIVSCDYTTDQCNLGKSGNVFSISKEKFLKMIIYEKCKTPQLWSFLFHKELIDSNNLFFTPGCVRNEDYEFFMKYIAHCEKPVIRIGYVGYFYRQNPQSVMHQRRSRSSVLMSIEATSKVSEIIAHIGVIPDKSLLTAFSVVTFLYIMSKERNCEMYKELHILYPVNSFVRKSLCHGGVRVRGAAFLYFILGGNLFYKVFSTINLLRS